MKEEKIHPLLYLIGICLIITGFSFPFCIAYIGSNSIFLGIVISLSLLIFFLYYLYIDGEDKTERKAEIEILLKENLFMRCSYMIFLMGLLANFCISISKDYGL